MKMIAKQPFINLKVDINSFLPENMENKTNLKLYNHYLKKFLNNPDLHDRLEFEIVLTCLDWECDGCDCAGTGTNSEECIEECGSFSNEHNQNTDTREIAEAIEFEGKDIYECDCGECKDGTNNIKKSLINLVIFNKERIR